MVTGQKHRIPRGNAIVEYTEYKLQPSDAGKGLKQIARERLNDENLYKDILQMTGTPNTQGISWYQEIEPKDRIGNNWTLLLPPALQAIILLQTPLPSLEHSNSPKRPISEHHPEWKPQISSCWGALEHNTPTLRTPRLLIRLG